MSGADAPIHVLLTVDAIGGVWTWARELTRELAGPVRFTLAVLGPTPTLAQRREMMAGHPQLTIVTHPGRLEWMPDADHDVARSGEWLVALAARGRPDVVHLTGYAHAALPFRRPVVVTAHSCVCSWWRAVKREPAPASWNAYRARVQAGLDSATLITAPTRAMLDALGREYRLSRPAIVINNGLAPAREPTLLADARQPDADAGVRTGGGSSGKRPLIFAAGRVWDEAKNLAMLDRVATRLSWPVWIAGPTDAPGVTSSREGGARLLGRLDPPDVRHLMTQAAIYAMPAKYEPFGLSILEAAQAGCALVLGDIASLRELWSGAALFVDPADEASLARALIQLASRPDLRSELAQRARLRAQRYTAEAFGRIHLSVYRELARAALGREEGRGSPYPAARHREVGSCA